VLPLGPIRAGDRRRRRGSNPSHIDARRRNGRALRNGAQSQRVAERIVSVYRRLSSGRWHGDREADTILVDSSWSGSPTDRRLSHIFVTVARVGRSRRRRRCTSATRQTKDSSHKRIFADAPTICILRVVVVTGHPRTRAERTRRLIEVTPLVLLNGSPTVMPSRPRACQTGRSCTSTSPFLHLSSLCRDPPTFIPREPNGVLIVRRNSTSKSRRPVTAMRPRSPASQRGGVLAKWIPSNRIRPLLPHPRQPSLSPVCLSATSPEEVSDEPECGHEHAGGGEDPCSCARTAQNSIQFPIEKKGRMND
jgi:hypothetical protein